jgi:DNA-binding MarR family transcriptional regulator
VSPESPAGRGNEAEVDRFADEFADAIAAWGMPRMSGRVLAHLLLEHPQALDQGALADRAGMSRGSSSVSLRLLVQLGFAERRRPIGSRRDLYRARPEGVAALAVLAAGSLRALRRALPDDLVARSEALGRWRGDLADLEARLAGTDGARPGQGASGGG